MTDTSKGACFVIAPIGEPDSQTRKQSDQVLKYIIVPAVEDCGYDTPVRADHIDKPGIITAQVIQQLVEAPLIIADLSDGNPNVYYELAVRHVKRKPVVLIKHVDSKRYFDLESARTINYDHQDLDSTESARSQIKKQIEKLEENPDDIDNPISMAIDILELRGSDRPVDVALAEIMAKLGKLDLIQTLVSRLTSIATTGGMTGFVSQQSHPGIEYISSQSSYVPGPLDEGARSVRERRLRRQAGAATIVGEGLGPLNTDDAGITSPSVPEVDTPPVKSEN